MTTNTYGSKLTTVFLLSMFAVSCGGKSTTKEEPPQTIPDVVVVDQPASASFMTEEPVVSEPAATEEAPPPEAEAPIMFEPPKPVIQPKPRAKVKRKPAPKVAKVVVPSPGDVLSEIFDAIRFDRATLSAPDSIKLDQQAPVDLVVDTASATQRMRAIIGAATDKGMKDVITGQLEAKLTSSDFKISGQSAESQKLSLPSPLNWNWKLKPDSAGLKNVELDLRLHLSVNNEADSVRSVKTLNKVITVEKLAPVEEPKSSNSWWIIVAILVLIAAVATMVIRGRSSPKR